MSYFKMNDEFLNSLVNVIVNDIHDHSIEDRLIKITNIKRCPFCYSKGELQRKLIKNVYNEDIIQHFVKCEYCGAQGGIITEIEDHDFYRLKAIDAWNRRDEE